MTESKNTKFKFKFSGVEIEINGEPQFVNKMYRKVLSDVERAQTFEGLPIPEGISEANDTSDDSLNKRIVWVHKCSTMMNKIYMSTNQELLGQPLLKLVDLNGISVIYSDRNAINEVLPGHEEGHTLWAELTSKGRREVEHTTKKKRKT